MAKCFGITVTSRMRHAGILRAVRACGSSSALARRLGVSPQEIGRWLNLKGVPSFSRGILLRNDCHQKIRERSLLRTWPPERISALEKELFSLTGQMLEDLFPPELCANEAFLNAHKQIEQTKDISTVRLSHIADHRLLLQSPADIVADKDMKQQIDKVLKTLSYRERIIIQMRYGIGDDDTPYSLSEVGRVFKMTAERIRQIEATAIRKLQQPSRASQLPNLD